MWMSELSRRSHVPVATIKFYLREGLLSPGESVGATRAHYDELHVRRLRLIRALVDVAGMRLDAVRAVLAAVDDDSLSMHEVLGSAHTRLSDNDSAPPSEAARRRVAELLDRLGWTVGAHSAHRESLARALDALEGLDHPASDPLLETYAEAMGSVADVDVSRLTAGSREAATEHAVVGTLLMEPVLLALRRMAHENLSSRRNRRRQAQ